MLRSNHKNNEMYLTFLRNIYEFETTVNLSFSSSILNLCKLWKNCRYLMEEVKSLMECQVDYYRL